MVQPHGLPRNEGQRLLEERHSVRQATLSHAGSSQVGDHLGRAGLQRQAGPVGLLGLLPLLQGGVHVAQVVPGAGFLWQRSGGLPQQVQRLGSLQYQGPQRVAEAVRRHLGPPQAALIVGDLGCGTGLCAADLRPFARQLHGCDLSAGMLAQARQRQLYDSLTQQELGAYLLARPDSFDLLVCADTLIYIGDLGPAMAAAAQALRPGGRLVFTIEALPDDDALPVRLQAHGRFNHRADHVRNACAGAGLQLAAPEPFVLRIEAGQAVPGWLGVTQRSARDGPATKETPAPAG